MIFRRITRAFLNQDWSTVIIELLVLIIGVFLGIQVSNWNEDRQNASRTQNYYSRLVDDLDSERRGLVARLDYLAVTNGYGQMALAAFDDPPAMRTSQFLIALYQASQIWTYSVGSGSAITASAAWADGTAISAAADPAKRVFSFIVVSSKTRLPPTEDFFSYAQIKIL